MGIREIRKRIERHPSKEFQPGFKTDFYITNVKCDVCGNSKTYRFSRALYGFNICRACVKALAK